MAGRSVLYVGDSVKAFLVGLDAGHRCSDLSRTAEWRKPVNLTSLTEPIAARLPEYRRKIMEAVIAEFDPGETQRLLLALVSAASKRERQLIRILLRDMEVKEEQDRVAGENQ